MRNLLLVVLLALLAPATVLGYNIVLKDGSTIVAKERYTVKGKRALVVLMNGSHTYIPLAEIDPEATEKANAEEVLSDVVVVTDKGVERFRRETYVPERERGLSDLLRERRADSAGEEDMEEDDSGVMRLRRTAGGFPDLMTFRRQPYPHGDIRADLAVLLAGSDLSRYKIYGGTREERIFIELVASSELEVFSSLELLTASLLELQQKHADVEALEILMTSATRKRSGQFVITAENAPLLVNGELDPSEFFVEFVEY